MPRIGNTPFAAAMGFLSCLSFALREVPCAEAATLPGSASPAVDANFTISPYVQDVGLSSSDVLWKPAWDETGQVEYGLTTAYGAVAQGAVRYVMKDGVAQPKKGSVVAATLTGLQANTLYHYRVALSSAASEDRTFRTAPADANAGFTFVVYGDSRSDPAAHARVASAAAAACDPSFVLTTGDAVPSSSSRQPKWIAQFFEPADPLLRKTWFLVTRGNHDAKSRLLSLYFEAPGGGQVEDLYSFDWGAVHFVTINTNKTYKPGTEQYLFLQNDLAATKKPFRVFFGHHPAYSSAHHGSTKRVQESLQPLFEANRVQLVFAGHDHCYERTIVNGITYVTSGGGGAPLYSQQKLKRNPTSLAFAKANNFVELKASADAISLTGWVVDGTGTAKIADTATVTP